MPKLTNADIKTRLTDVPAWKLQGSAIQRTWKFEDFAGAMRFVNQVAELAEEADHHPDIDIRWNKVTLTLATHSEGGLTEDDFELAEQLDRL